MTAFRYQFVSGYSLVMSGSKLEQALELTIKLCLINYSVRFRWTLLHVTWNIVVESIEQILIGSVMFVFNVEVSELERMKKK